VFAQAYAIASEFTWPVIILSRRRSGAVECGLGAFVLLNNDGWFVTVTHILDVARQHAEHAARARQPGRTPDPNWISDYSYWWGADDPQAHDVEMLPEGDLAIGRLEPYNRDLVSQYPVLKSPRNLRPGTSLCKLGFPFYDLVATYDEPTQSFRLPPDVLPIPRFPIEGIYTHDVTLGRSNDGRYDLKLLETSSPGLRGQSGGPIFDAQGRVWAIQSRTTHHPLGFSPTVMRNGRAVEEHQFLNVGCGVHPELLVSFLRDHGVRFQLSRD
jgi:hypothetical protein